MKTRSGHLPGLSPAALDSLISHDWPGNVRELRNAIQRAVVMTEKRGADRTGFLLPAPGGEAGRGSGEPSGLSRWEQAERTNILGELARQMGNKTKTARELGIAKSTLFEKLKRYGIRTAEFDR